VEEAVSTESSPPSISRVPMSQVLARVEQELRDLWAAPAPGEPLPARVCTMNLLVVTGSSEVAERYMPVVDAVAHGTPARTLVVTVTPNAPVATLEGEVAAIRGEGGVTSSERVVLRASGAATARVASAALALVVPELPTTLIWLGRVLVDDPIFRELAESSDRIVLDTEYTSLSSLLALSRWARSRRAKIGIADLAWTRIGVWQEMCARFFDDPRMRPLAFRVESLRLVQMSEPGARLGPEGTLLLGWLATRLGWKLEPIGGALRFRRADGKLVHVDLATMPRPEGVAPLAIASVGLAAKDVDVTATGTVARDFAGDVADVLRYKLEANLPCAGEQTVRLGANRTGRVLERTLHRPAHDDAFLAAVEFAEKLDEDGAVCT
jgi:glucose-6-phosphate dehydrogenase assembly protein OpcA